MNSLIRNALKNSWLALAQPQVLVRLVLPFFISLFAGIFIVIAAWYTLYRAAATSGFRQIEMFAWLVQFYETTLGQVIVSTFFGLFLIALFIVSIYFLTILFTSLLVVPLLSRVVHKIYFPDVVKKDGLSFVGAIWNLIKAVLAYLTAFLLCSPLLFIPGMQIIIPLALNTFLVRKLFLYDVLQDFASKEEFVAIDRKHGKSIWIMSFISGAYLFIPFINLLGPALMALGFLFLGLQLLRNERK